MGYQARWGPKGFIISPKKIVAIEDFKTSYELKTDTNEDTSGTPPTNTKGRELQPVTMSTQYLRATGTDPRGQIEEWGSLVGKHHPLCINEKVFGPANMQLQKVDVSDVLFNNEGVMLGCTVSLTFMEYSVSSTTNGATTSKAGAGSGAYTKDELNKMALNTTASKDDKNSKKVQKAPGVRGYTM